MAEYQTPEFHPAFEEYCEAIYELHEDDVDVIQARIAERLEISRPAVSEMIRRLEAAGLVAIDGAIKLTTAGNTLAEKVVRRHRLAERFLTDILELSWADAHTEAGKWEHVISEPVEKAMMRVLGDPTTCPHGNPIPGLRLLGPADGAPRRPRAGRQLHRGPHPRGAGVRPRPAQVPRGGGRRPRPVRHGSPRRHPTAPSRWTSTAGRSASAPSPAPASSSPPADPRPSASPTRPARPGPASRPRTGRAWTRSTARRSGSSARHAR